MYPAKRPHCQPDLSVISLQVFVQEVIPRIPQVHVTGILLLRRVCQYARRVIDHSDENSRFWQLYKHTNLRGISGTVPQIMRTLRHLETDFLTPTNRPGAVRGHLRIFQRGARRSVAFELPVIHPLPWLALRPIMPEGPVNPHGAGAPLIWKPVIVLWGTVYAIFVDDAADVPLSMETLGEVGFQGRISGAIYLKPGHVPVGPNGFLYGFHWRLDEPCMWECTEDCQFQCRRHVRQ
jgi:hypothetical protein